MQRKVGERLAKMSELARPSDEPRARCRHRIVTWRPGAGPRRRRRRRGTEDGLIQRLGRRLRLDVELAAEDVDAQLILTERGRPAAGVDVQLHEGAVHGLLKGIEREQTQTGPDRRLRVASALVPEEPRVCRQCELAQTLALAQEPLLERRLIHLQAFEEVAAVDVRRLDESGRVAPRHEPFEPPHVHVDEGAVEDDAIDRDVQSA